MIRHPADSWSKTGVTGCTSRYVTRYVIRHPADSWFNQSEKTWTGDLEMTSREMRNNTVSLFLTQGKTHLLLEVNSPSESPSSILIKDTHWAWITQLYPYKGHALSLDPRALGLVKVTIGSYPSEGPHRNLHVWRIALQRTSSVSLPEKDHPPLIFINKNRYKGTIPILNIEYSLIKYLNRSPSPITN